VLQPSLGQTASGASAESSVEGSSSGDDDAWKEEYETHVQTWRAQSAEQRDKAEKERLKWESIRNQEREEAERRKSAGGISVQESWEKLGASGSSVASTAASSQADVWRVQYFTEVTYLTSLIFPALQSRPLIPGRDP
jgi:hypothetical protein